MGVKQGECFGLLGINGSGKTTTFKMLTGEISTTGGNAFVNNYSVIKQLDAVHRNLGYLKNNKCLFLFLFNRILSFR